MIRARMSLFSALVLSVLACAVCRPASAQLTFNYMPFNLGDDNSPDVFGLSNTGDVAGAGLLNNDSHGIVRHNGVETALDYPGAVGTTLININSSGDVTGLRFYTVGGGTYHLEFLYHNGVFNTFDSLAGLPPGSTYVNDINGVNDAGKVGIGYLDAQYTEHGAIYDIASNTFTLVPDVSQSEYTAGEVTFVATNGDYLQEYNPDIYNGDVYSALIHDGVPTEIDFPGAIETDAYSINASGLIAGTYFTGYDLSEEHGFVYDHGAYYSLDYPYPGSFGTTILYGLNDADQIVGTYYTADYHSHGLLIQITPEPGSIALLVGMGVTGAGFLVRRNRVRRAM